MTMRLSGYLALPLALALTSCSYSYDVLATVIGGRLAFIVDPKSAREAECINAVEVQMDGPEAAPAEPGDNPSRVSYGTYWYERASYDCKNPFPVFYGTALKGGPSEDEGVVEVVAASEEAEGRQGPYRDYVRPKPLKIGVVYRVSTTTGATGYGGGAFIIRPDRTVQNLPL